MPALSSDATAGQREARIVMDESATIKARYPDRDQADRPAEGFFDSATDAAAALAQRRSLIGTERRRYAVTVNDLIWIDPETAIPTVRLIDSEQVTDTSCLIARVQIDLETETTAMELFG